MRIKLLSAIVSLLVVSVVISACLDSDVHYEYSSDATIHAFGLDTIHGKHYKFTIDQLQNLIYNRDSLPVGADTIINKILIDTFSVVGGATVTSGAPMDTLFNTADSVNLLPAMNKSGTEGMKFTVHAADGIGMRTYTVQVRVHLQDPDSLVWYDLQQPLEPTPVTSLKAVIPDDERLLVYTSSTNVYIASIHTATPFAWQPAVVSGLPDDLLLGSVIRCQEHLYAIDASGKLYTSPATDGLTWSEVNTQGILLVQLLAPVKTGEAELLTAIAAIDGTEHFCTSADGLTWSTGEAVPDNFPTDGLHFTTLINDNKQHRVVLVGNAANSATATVPWSTMTGSSWVDWSTNSGYYCPAMENPFIMYYNRQYYIFGGAFDAIYTSVTGLEWNPTTKKFLLPAAMKGKHTYSAVVDANGYIWVVIGQTTDDEGNHTIGTVWRGRLNKLGFADQG
jgi:hypothetical protein